MNGNTAKIRLKLGELEVECEGNELFLKNDLSNLLNTTANLLKECGIPPPFGSSPTSKETAPTGGNSGIDLAVSTIASRMNAATAPDLAIAASTYLTLVKGKEKFSRKEIHTEMQNASGHYNSNMLSNLSPTLKRLVDRKRLNKAASGAYALTANERAKMEKLLAQQC